MQIKGEALASVLERPLPPLITVHGDDPLLTLEATDAIRGAARRQGFDEREVMTVLPGFDWKQLFVSGSNLSLFGGRKLVDLRIPSGKPGRDGSEALQAWCRQSGGDTLTLISLPEMGWQEEKSPWFTALDKAGLVVKCLAPRLEALPQWLAQRLARQQQQATREALQFLAEQVEGNLLAAHQEIQKLALLYPTGELSLEQIRDAVLDVARYDLEGLREALLSGDVGRLVRTLEGLRQEGEALPLILWAVTEDLRALLNLKQGIASGRPFDALCKEARVWGPRQMGMKKALARADLPTLRQGLTTCARVDRMIKGVAQGDPWLELQRLGMLLAGTEALRRRTPSPRP